MATPLTDSINALTAYANEVTGGSDTTLSDAVHTLANGYGQGGYAPNGYIRLLYLESSGVQGIDTGKYLKLNSKFVVDCCYVPVFNYGYFAYMFGSANPMVYADTVSATKQFGTGNGYWRFGNSSEVALSFCHHDRGIIELSKDIAAYHNYNFATITRSSALNATVVEENPNSHLCLFCRGENGEYNRFAACRIYEYWYYEDDVLIQHMIPVKRKSDNVLGMYDLVEDVFYTNIGTGTFIEGAWV